MIGHVHERSRYAQPLLVIFLCLMSFGESRATTASKAEMDRVCQNWLSRVVYEQGSWAGSASPGVSAVHEIKEGDVLLARWYDVEPEGFVVVPVLKELPPVKAFSEYGTLEQHDVHGIAALLRDVLSDRVRKYEATYGGLNVDQEDRDRRLFDLSNRRVWEQLLVDESEYITSLRSGKYGSRDQVGPLLTTAWHQTAPYNSYCPMGDGAQSVVWCVATALAQIIWYHQWPPAGFGHTSYLWNGDQSCGGSTPGKLLVGNFSDRFFYEPTIHNMAKMSMEVGKAYNVDYGVCYSIGSPYPIFDLLPDNFGYLDAVTEELRSSYTAAAWFALIQQEIDNDRPIDYLIYNHMIVADGWMTAGELSYYHMNYGWGGSANAWYAIDNLYCDWAGCDPMWERIYIGIYPDRGLMFYADTIAGQAPLTVEYTASSDLSVTKWTWDFGDGDSAEIQNPVHLYTTPGIYDVTLAIDYAETSRTMTRTEYLYVLADTATATCAEVSAGVEIEIQIDALNSMPLSQIVIPIQYSGSLELVYDSHSVEGCRTADFQQVSETFVDSAAGQRIVEMHAWISGYSAYPFLGAGSGPILKLHFTVSPEATPGQTAEISLGGVQSQEVSFYGSIYGFEHVYQPAASFGTVSVAALCGDIDGSGDPTMDIADLVHLVDYMFNDGPPPPVMWAADVDGSGGVDISDLVYVVDYMFNDGPEPACL